MLTLQSSHLELQTKLDRVEVRSRKEPMAVFNNLGHILNEQLLRKCFEDLNGRKAPGIDGMTKERYGKELERNVKQLLHSVRRLSYRAKPCRITLIPKENGESRPIAVSCLTDKLVQDAVRRVLERIYEPIFSEASYGGRPGRGAHNALCAVDQLLMRGSTQVVYEIDFRDFFGSIPHRLMIGILKKKIGDRRFLQLVVRLLRTPIQEANGEVKMKRRGLPQGSILSPSLSNIFLNHVIDQWFNRINEELFGGEAAMVRYLDDAIFTFRDLSQSKRFESLLKARIVLFGLELNESKSRIVASGRLQAWLHEQRGEEMPRFSFLGFVHAWGKGWSKKKRKHFYRVKRYSDPKRFRKKLREAKQYIARNRHSKELLPSVKRAVVGYLNYFAINDNRRRCEMFVAEVYQILLKYLNRRSQKKGMSHQRLSIILKEVGYPFHFTTKNILNSFTGFEPLRGSGVP